jgi:hypothetical protein
MGGGTPTDDEQAAALEGQLDRALEEFDGVLLDEQERLEQQAAGSGGSGAGSGGSGGTGSGQSGGVGGGSAGGSQGGEGQGSAGNDAAGSRDGRDAGGMVGGGSGGGGADGSGADERAPADVGDGSDDDIVARQLREAAMSEEDPELRERLWDEYRKYKGLPVEAGDEQ